MPPREINKFADVGLHRHETMVNSEHVMGIQVFSTQVKYHMSTGKDFTIEYGDEATRDVALQHLTESGVVTKV